MPSTFPVIDLFAGPGGLGEGFSAFTPPRGGTRFAVRLSIEMNQVAHQTLLLRKFFRAFDEPPEAYHEYTSGRLTRDELFARYATQHLRASDEAWCTELGRQDHATVTKRINLALRAASGWALVGGPPCQAYSLVGRSRMQSAINPDFEKDHRHFLYREYLRIVARHEPPVFLMENVKGLLSATHGGDRMIQRILSDLREPKNAIVKGARPSLTYRLYSVRDDKGGSLAQPIDSMLDPESLLIRAEDFGIPQARHRIFILGIREDLKVAPPALKLSDEVRVSDVIDDLPPLRSSVSRGKDSIAAWQAAIAGVRDQRWYLHPKDEHMRAASRVAKESLAALLATKLSTGDRWQPWTKRPSALSSWYRSDCRGISNHQARSHMKSDLQRYFFMACFAKANGYSATLRDFPDELMPKHKNAELGREGKMHSDRFKTQMPDEQSSTITSHISKDGHHFIHYDPTQCRSLTVREAARLQTFPDNYHFEGPRTEQYHQVGNAVPPLLAKKIAGIVHNVLVKAFGA